MDRYQKLNAAEKVRGYYFPNPSETVLGKNETAFDRAKNECLHHLREQISCIEALTFEIFKNPKL